MSMKNMLKIIEEHNIEIDREINGDCFCTICYKIMVDACISPCGCRYCRKCIIEYLRTDKRKCPGQTEDCKSHPIDIDNDICKDQAMNIKISKLKVSCPNMYCDLKLELRSVENHLRICKKQSHSCPFTNIGCVEDKLQFDKLDEHLASEVCSHSQLLIDWINISMNDMESTKKDLETLELENIDLKHKIKLTEEKIKSLLTKNDVQCIIIKQIRQMFVKEVFLFLTLNIIGVFIILNLTTPQVKIIEEMKESMNKNWETLKMENAYLKNKIAEIEKQNQVLFTKNAEQDKIIEEIKQKYYRNSQDFESRLDKLSLENWSIKESIVETRIGEIVLIIDKWSEKLKQAKNGINEIIYSDEFFSHRNGYKMQLHLHPNGHKASKGKYLSIFFYIKKGPFDNILQWPCKYGVEFALLNQLTGLPHKTILANNLAFLRPINERNDYGYGYFEFIEISEILNNDGLIKNDQIIIKGTVKQ